MRTALALAIVLVASCCKKPVCPVNAAKTVDPPVVAVMAPELPCNLPTLPVPIQVVGMASEQGVLVTKTDLQSLVIYLAGIRAWVDAAQLCIGGQR